MVLRRNIDLENLSKMEDIERKTLTVGINISINTTGIQCCGPRR